MLRKYTAAYLWTVWEICLQNLVLKISGEEGIAKIYAYIFTYGRAVQGVSHLKYIK